jgi:HK97 family phage major capsid protein
MLEQRNQLVAELRSFTDAMQDRAAENKGEPLGEDETEFERREKELVDLNKRITVEKRAESLVSARPETFSAETGWEDDKQETFEEYRAREFAASRPRVLRELEDRDVAKAVYSWIIKGRDGMEADEYRVLSKAASGGGFFVPTELADQVIRALRFLPGGVTALAREAVTSTGDTFNVPANLTHGTAAWIAESGSYTPSDETITNVALSAFKAGTKIIVSEELLTDSAFDLTSFVTTEFGERIGALAEAAYISGDGSGKPTGILDAASAVSVATLPAGYVTTLAWAGLATAIYSVPAQYRANLSILVSDSLLVKLIATQDSTGGPLWAPGASAGAPDRFAGFPIYSHPNLAAVGANAKSAIVGDFNRGYWIRRVDGVFMQRQNELHSDSGQVGFRAYLRLDGKVALADALRVVAFAAT